MNKLTKEMCISGELIDFNNKFFGKAEPDQWINVENLLLAVETLKKEFNKNVKKRMSLFELCKFHNELVDKIMLGWQEQKKEV